MSEPTWATRAYVTDSFKITFRTGPSTKNQIISMLSSGQAVEVLESNEDWSRIRPLNETQNGKEGWVLSRFLVNRLPWKTQATTLRDENARMREKLTRIERELNEKLQEGQEVSLRLRENREAFRKLKTEHESLRKGAAEYLSLKAIHSKTRSALKFVEKEVQRLKAENERLRSSERHKWLAIGALVLLFGLIIGVVIGKQQKKRRSPMYS
jgi:SH3 domain protein